MKSLCLVATAVALITGCSTTSPGQSSMPGKDDGYYVTGSLTKRKAARPADSGTEQQPGENKQTSGGGALHTPIQ